MSRRRFLNRMLGTSALAFAATAAKNTLAQPSARDRRRLVADAQVHLWPANSPELAWVRPPPQMPEPFTIEKALPLMDEAGVDRVVIVTPALLGHNNSYSLEAARRYPKRFAVMGRIEQDNPKAAALFPTWKEQPGMLGVRVSFLGASAASLNDGTADWIWPAAEKADLPVMFLTTVNSAYFGRVAERHPRLTLIADHMGVSGEAVKAGKRDEAFDQTVALAKYPNVSVKLSAIGNFSEQPYPFRDAEPYIRRLFDAFGRERCYWGTDITNSFARATYRQRITHFTEELPFLSEEDKDWIMGRGIVNRLGWTSGRT
jgi:predicted TIM-barrel fold metal-dependent hydrolase